MVLATFSLLGDDPLHIFKASAKSRTKENVKFFEKLEKRIKDKSEVKLRNTEYEMLIFIMFTVTQVARGNKIPDEVLDDYTARIYKHLADSKVIEGYGDLHEFDDWLVKRYEEYYKALSNEAGYGPMFHFGIAALENIFNTEYDTEDVDVALPVFIANISVNYAKGIKESLIDKYQIT
jgi:hypothetical protein